MRNLIRMFGFTVVSPNSFICAFECFKSLCVRSLCSSACFVKQKSSAVPSQVVQGLLAVFYNLGDGDYNLTLPHQHLGDGEWHEVELDRYGREFTLRLDGGGGRREITASRGQGHEIIVDPTVVMLGNSFPSGHNHSFLGRSPSVESDRPEFANNGCP